jgi:hypothetical protein
MDEDVRALVEAAELDGCMALVLSSLSLCSSITFLHRLRPMRAVWP